MTRVPSRSITTSPIVLPAARDPGSSVPVSSPRASQARSRACARASRISLSIAASMPARTRQIVGVDATDPAGLCRPWLISQRLHIGNRHRPVGDHHRHIDQHPARVVTGPACPQPIGGLTQRGGQPDPVRQLRQQHRPGVRHHPCPVDRDDRDGPARWRSPDKYLSGMVICPLEKRENPIQCMHFRLFTVRVEPQQQRQLKQQGSLIGSCVLTRMHFRGQDVLARSQPVAGRRRLRAGAIVTGGTPAMTRTVIAPTRPDVHADAMATVAGDIVTDRTRPRSTHRPAASDAACALHLGNPRGSRRVTLVGPGGTPVPGAHRRWRPHFCRTPI